jgi:hypothetical protein
LFGTYTLDPLNMKYKDGICVQPCTLSDWSTRQNQLGRDMDRSLISHHHTNCVQWNPSIRNEDISQNQDTVQLQWKSVQHYPWNKDTSFNQDTLNCPKDARNRGLERLVTLPSLLYSCMLYNHIMYLWQDFPRYLEAWNFVSLP